MLLGRYGASFTLAQELTESMRLGPAWNVLVRAIVARLTETSRLGRTSRIAVLACPTRHW